MKYYVLLLPYKTGIFTSTDKLLYELREGSIHDYKTVFDWKEAVCLIRSKYSIESLFLMGIENLSGLPKNIAYFVPFGNQGKYTESEIQDWEVIY